MTASVPFDEMGLGPTPIDPSIAISPVGSRRPRPTSSRRAARRPNICSAAIGHHLRRLRRQGRRRAADPRSDIVPRVISRAEWTRAGGGLTQRVTALNLFLKGRSMARERFLKENIIAGRTDPAQPAYGPR